MSHLGSKTSKKRNSNETNVKYVKNENISLVTGPQVRQFYASEDRDSYKVERVKLFQNNPTPEHHSRYLPESRTPKKSKSRKSTFCGLSSKGKKLISYCLIYALMFTCAISLLYLFYTPQQMNLFGFYTNNNLRLKFYRFVLGTNGSSTITPKIIITTEPTIFITQSSSSTVHLEVANVSTTKIRPYSITQPSITKVTSTSTTPNIISTFQVDKASTTQSTLLESYTLTDETVTKSSIDTESHRIDGSKKNNKVNSYTTCVTINTTEPTQAPISAKNDISTGKNTVQSTVPPFLTAKSKMIEVSKKTTTTVSTTISPKDNSTETLEFKEKFPDLSTQFNNAEKNETTYDETIIDNEVLPTEEEEEERKKDEIESKQKIASFFGVDPVTGKERNGEKGKEIFLASNAPKPINGDNQLNKVISNIETNQKQSNRWFLNSNQQFGGNREFIGPTKSPKEDEFKYNPMLKLLYGSCYNHCN